MNVKHAFLLLSLVVLSAACSKKNSTSLPPKTVVGYWRGFYGGNNAYPNGYWGPTGTTIDGSSGGDFYLVRQLQ